MKRAIYCGLISAVIGFGVAAWVAPLVEGKLRQAGQQERSLMILWSRAFQHEIGESEDGTNSVWTEVWQPDNCGCGIEVENRSQWPLPESHYWASSVCLASTPHQRNGSMVTRPHAFMLSRRSCVTLGLRCILYTDLGNTTSNSIYRRIGYRAVAEVLRYRFE